MPARCARRKPDDYVPPYVRQGHRGDRRRHIRPRPAQGTVGAHQGAHGSRRAARRPQDLRSDLDHRQHDRQPRSADLRHAVRHGRRSQRPAADGRQVGRLRRQEDLHVHAARWPEVPRRTSRHQRRRRRLDPPLVRPRRRRAAHVQAGRRHADQGRQDLPDRAQGALRPGARRARQDRDQPARHHAQEGRGDGPEPAGDDQGRLRSLHVQRGRDQVRPALRLRQEPELRAPQRAAVRHGRRQDRQARSRHHREHGRRADGGRGPEGRRDRFLRGPADRPARPARERQEHQARRPEQGRQRRHVPSQLAASALRQGRGAPGHAPPHQAGGHPQGGVRQPEILPLLRVAVRLHRPDAERRQHRLVQGRPEHRQGAGAVQEGRL